MQRLSILRLNQLIALLVTAVFTFLCPAAFAAEPPINTLKNSLFGGRTDTAINVYDTVAGWVAGLHQPLSTTSRRWQA